jgi:hypothetical protein
LPAAPGSILVKRPGPTPMWNIPVSEGKSNSCGAPDHASWPSSLVDAP